MDDSRRLADAPEDVRSNKRYAEMGAFSITALAQRLDRPARPSRSTSNPRINFPSAERSGIKIRLKGPLTVGDSTTQTHLVDSDLGSSFDDEGDERSGPNETTPRRKSRRGVVVLRLPNSCASAYMSLKSASCFEPSAAVIVTW